MIRQVPRRLWAVRNPQRTGRLFSICSVYKQQVASPTPSTPFKASSLPTKPKHHDLTSGLLDPLPAPEPVADDAQPSVDWSRSFAGLSTTSFSPEASAILMDPIKPEDVEVKPDGIIYLPEIKYRRILNRAFGPGAWGLAPRGETIVTARSVTREYGLVVQGRYVMGY